MTIHNVPVSPRITARLAGFLYLLVVPLGIFSLYVSSRLIVSGNAAKTAGNILASESLFRLGMVSDLFAALVMLMVVLVLYRLLEPVNKNVAVVMVVFVLVAVPITMLNKLNQFAVLQILNGGHSLSVFTSEQLQTLALVFLRLHSRGANIAFIFWGLWLLPLGYLVLRSGFFPKILGVLLMIACFGYLINSFSIFLGYNLNAGRFSALGEVLFILWLLIKGVNVEQWQKHVLETT